MLFPSVLSAPGPVTLRRMFRGIFVLAVLTFHVAAPAAAQGVPDPTRSFFVPQVGPVSNPSEGTVATRLFRVCPNNDGGTSLPNHARIKVVLLDSDWAPITGVPAEDIYVRFNGGTAEQGFTGDGADSIVANSSYNPDPACPDVRVLTADAPTDVTGTTYITFHGSTPGSPGVATRDPNRKWGHYDSELPVYALGVKLAGQLTSISPPGSYVLRIRNFDFQEGLGTVMNEGAAVTAADFNSIVPHLLTLTDTPVRYWVDFDGNGIVNVVDLNLFASHFNHDCDTPFNP
jgi:hypothetical protein